MAEPAAGRFMLYGRRHGRRLRPRGRTLIGALLPQLAVTLPKDGTPVDLAALFGADIGRYWLEIGFGGGEHLAWQAALHPEVGLIGAEFFVNGVASLLGHVERGNLANVRIHADDARPLLIALPTAAIERVFVLYPDPWPKARHARRRFISPENLDRLARILRPGGELRIATDDPAYLRWTLQHLTRRPDFEWLALAPADWRQRPADWPATRYEEKAIGAGRRPVYLRFRRRAGTPQEQGRHPQRKRLR